MKTIFKIIYLLFLFTNISISQNITFDRDYTVSASSSNGHIVEQAPNGEYLVGGLANEDLLVMKTDSLGNVLFSKRFRRSSDFLNLRTSPVHLTRDGGYIITTGIGSFTGNMVYIAKLDSMGSLLWETTVSDTVGVFGTDILEIEEDKYLSAGLVEKNIVSLSCISSSGNIIWSKKMIFPYIAQLLVGPMIIGLSDNNFLLAHDRSLLKFNINGDSLWQLNTDFKIASIKTTPDGNIVAAGFRKFTKIDLQGNILWTKELNAYIDCIENSYDNGFILVQNKSIISKFDSLGKFIWNKSIFPQVNFISSTNDSGYIFTGNFLNHLRLLKTDDVAYFEYVTILNGVSFNKLEIFKDYKIEWRSHNIENVDIEYKIDGGENWIEIVSKYPAETQQYIWNVPNTQSTNCLLRISSSTKPNLFDILINKFSIYNEPIILLRPNGGERYLSNRGISIKWEGQPFSDIKFELTTDGGDNYFEVNVEERYGNSAYSEPINSTSKKCKIKITDLKDSTNFDESENFFTLHPVNVPSHDYISVNECLMWIGNNGMSSHNPTTDASGFFWPEGENATVASVFADGIVWGGIHEGMVKVNGATYRYGLTAGKILQNGEADDSNDPRYKIFKIRKDWESLPDDSIKSQYQYDYENWPGDLGAPFVDLNGDGIFTKGIDEPDFIGDEVLFYVANDLDSFYTEFTYGSPPIGLEFQQTLFAYNTPELKDAVFKKVKLINKSNSPIDSMYITYWTDDDMGWANDDFVGFDKVLNLGYSYNGDNDDEDNYGPAPPTVGHLLLQGPIVKGELTDSALYNGKYLTGYNNLPMTSSMFYIGSSAIFGDPELGVYAGAGQFYYQMQGRLWNGDPVLNPVTGDTTVFGLDGDPVNGIGWYEGEGWSGGELPADRRYIMSSGPFTMAPGDTQEVVYAIFMARGSSNIQSVAELKKSARLLHEFWGNDIPVSVSRNNNLTPTQFSLSQNYPNPFNPSTTIKYSIPQSTVILSKAKNLQDFSSQSPQVNGAPQNDNVNVELIVYDILGRKVKTLVNQKQLPGNYEVEFNASKLASGMYFYRLNVSDNVAVRKMMLLK